MNEIKISVQTDAYIYTQGKLHEKTKFCWVVLHGYGQLASNIIRKFEHLDEQNFVIAPEALSHFYWRLGEATVGASWMTKAHRLNEIERFSQYLRQVYDMYLADLAADVRIIWVGFSQGATTLFRFFQHELLRGVDFRCHEILIWGARLPEDIDYQLFLAYCNTHFIGKNIHFFIGNNDEFITENRLYDFENFAITHKIPFQFHLFEGRHEILVSELEKWRKNFL